MSIRVYILPDIGKDRSKKLASTLFNDSKFEVVIPSFDLLPKNIKGLETKKVLNILSNAKQESPNKHVLIIRDSSTTTMEPTMMKTLIEQAVTDGGFDILYLCRWMDQCDTNRKVAESDNGLVSRNTTEHARGFQAVMFSPSGRDKTISFLRIEEDSDLATIISAKVAAHKLEAAAFTPNLIDFDISLSTDKKKDAFKTVTCEVPKPVEPAQTVQTTGSESNAMLYVIIAVGIVLLILIFRQ